MRTDAQFANKQTHCWQLYTTEKLASVQIIIYLCKKKIVAMKLKTSLLDYSFNTNQYIVIYNKWI